MDTESGLSNTGDGEPVENDPIQNHVLAAGGCSTPLCGKLSPFMKQALRLAHLAPRTLETNIHQRPDVQAFNKLVRYTTKLHLRSSAKCHCNLKSNQSGGLNLQKEDLHGKDVSAVYKL